MNNLKIVVKEWVEDGIEYYEKYGLCTKCGCVRIDVATHNINCDG